MFVLEDNNCLICAFTFTCLSVMEEKIYIHGQVQTKEQYLDDQSLAAQLLHNLSVTISHENQYKEKGGMDIVKRAEESKDYRLQFTIQKIKIKIKPEQNVKIYPKPVVEYALHYYLKQKSSAAAELIRYITQTFIFLTSQRQCTYILLFQYLNSSEGILCNKLSKSSC